MDSQLAHPSNAPAHRAKIVKSAAKTLGFDACGVAPAVQGDTGGIFSDWLAKGYHAGMTWMAKSSAVRKDVTLKVPNARSVVVLVRNYFAEEPSDPSGSGRVARYAWGRDYHRVLRKPLRRLAKYIRDLEPGAQAYASVDSGPVLERDWAARAGVGWIGKNSLVLREDLGSWFFLATVITTVELEPDTPVSDHCGTCRACLDACPTDAILDGRIVDSNRCISYHTIENRGAVPEEMRRSMGDWAFGCDICQDVCPWNRFAKDTNEPDFAPRPEQVRLDLDRLEDMSKKTFDETFAGAALRRAKYEGMIRNAKIVRENLSS